MANTHPHITVRTNLLCGGYFHGRGGWRSLWGRKEVQGWKVSVNGVMEKE